MNKKYFTFVEPYLSYIDGGHLYRKPFSWLYALLAIVNLFVPILIFIQALENSIFRSPAKIIIVFFLVWIMIAITSWISFLLWWDRKSKVLSTSSEGDDFFATPVFSHLIQTIGEWLGTWIGIVGFSIALFTTLFLGGNGYYLSMQLGLSFLQTGSTAIILMPVIGFLIIVITRFLAEQFRALASIANNTKKD